MFVHFSLVDVLMLVLNNDAPVMFPLRWYGPADVQSMNLPHRDHCKTHAYKYQYVFNKNIRLMILLISS